METVEREKDMGVEPAMPHTALLITKTRGALSNLGIESRLTEAGMDIQYKHDFRLSGR